VKNENRMSEAQKEFLREVRDGDWTLDELMKAMEVKNSQWARWLQNKFFVGNLKRMGRVSTRWSRVALMLAANVARKELAKSVGKTEGIPAEKRETLKDTVTLSNADARQQRSEDRLRVKKKPALDPERDLLHPSFAGREGEFLAAMKSAGTKAGE